MVKNLGRKSFCQVEVQASNEFHFMRDKEIQQLKINLVNSESRNGALKCELSNNQWVYEKDLRVMKDSMRRENELMRKKLHEVEKNYNSVHMELWSTQRSITNVNQMYIVCEKGAQM